MVTGPTPPFFIVTGGPGAGKTTLIETLAAAGFATAAEAGRHIIREQQETGGRALPWVDPLAFADAMLARDIESYLTRRNVTGPVFFDRGIPDVIGYLRLEGLSVSPTILRAAREYRYHGPIFICSPWPAIYTTDNERKQSPAEAERTYRAMIDVYSDFGYELLEVPRAPVETRSRSVHEAAREAMR